MSLMKLLSAGKSWVGLKDEGSRYRLGNPGMLPKFGAGRNPFGVKKAASGSDQADKSDRSDRMAAPASIPGASQAQASAAKQGPSQTPMNREQAAKSQGANKQGNWASKVGWLLGV